MSRRPCSTGRASPPWQCTCRTRSLARAALGGDHAGPVRSAHLCGDTGGHDAPSGGALGGIQRVAGRGAGGVGRGQAPQRDRISDRRSGAMAARADHIVANALPHEPAAGQLAGGIAGHLGARSLGEVFQGSGSGSAAMRITCGSCRPWWRSREKAGPGGCSGC